ncbi:trimeric intracellular cation channel family protein [[Ruminococcus] torques]|uniref:trimeric intracellular cation channel family protein n=1 Tax=[Ruminococcus] torques TaxID=33039 RepID=UPI0027B94F7C|nr:TRIC cation channel family protein [[Ruminococcus] torques]
MDEFIFILELIGTVAFASSGAMIAIEKKMDIFGVNVLGATTAVGGGIMRDIILGLTPPGAFSHPVYVLVAALTSTILFVIAYAKPTAFESRVKTEYYDKLMFWCDTAGLGIFTVVGIQAAVRAVGGENVFFFVFIGTLTGVGGGVLRDIMAGETPYILVKHIYACAAIAGGIVCVVGRTAFGEAYGTILGLAATVLLRFLAAHFRWNLMRVS